MVSCYLDANFLVYLKNETSPLHSYTKSLIEKLIEEKFQLVISPLVIDEFLHSILFILKRMKTKNIELNLRKFLGEILNLPNLTIINSPTGSIEQFDVIKFMTRFSLHPRDACHLLIMKANKISHFATFDEDFEKVFKSKIIIPLKFRT